MIAHWLKQKKQARRECNNRLQALKKQRLVESNFRSLFGFPYGEMHLAHRRREVVFRLGVVSQTLCHWGRILALQGPTTTTFYGDRIYGTNQDAYDWAWRSWEHHLEIIRYFYPATADRIAECHWSQHLSHRLQALLNGQDLSEINLLSETLPVSEKIESQRLTA